MLCFVRGTVGNIETEERPKRDGSGTWFARVYKFITMAQGKMNFVEVQEMSDEKLPAVNPDIQRAFDQRKDIELTLDCYARDKGQLSSRIVHVEILGEKKADKAVSSGAAS